MNEMTHLTDKIYPDKKYNKIINDLSADIIINDVVSGIVKTISDIDDRECRICFEEETEDNILIWPCKCRGTSKYVHEKCLNQWRYENIDRPAFELCMECRYKYRFTNEYPHEFFSRIPTKAYFICVLSHIIPIIFTYPLTQINHQSNNSILNFYSFRNNNSIVYYINKHPIQLSSMNYDLCYTIVLFTQSLFFMLFYILFVCKNIYRKKIYLIRLKKWLFPYFIYLFKFLIFYNIDMGELSIVSVFLTFSIMTVCAEPIFYSTVINNHNSVIFFMDLENKYKIQNYEIGDENIVRSISDIIYD